MQHRIFAAGSIFVGLAAACATSSSPTLSGSGAGTSASSSQTAGNGGAVTSTTVASSSSSSEPSSSVGSGTTSSGGGVDYACEVKSTLLHYCVQYESLSPTLLSSEMAGCASLLGTSGTTCPTANAIGSCTGTAGGVTGVTTWYSDGATTAAEAQASCESAAGTWTPG